MSILKTLQRTLVLGFSLSALLSLSVQAQIKQSEHVEDDLEWSRQKALEPAFIVDQSKLRIPTLNELNTLGEWSEVIDWPHTPVSAANLPDGRILTYSSNAEESWPSGQAEFTYAAAWDPQTGEFKMVPHNTHDMFCAELVLTDKGKVHVTGGRNSVPTTSLFDAVTETWTVVDGMSIGRWYPTSVALPNGDVFTALGSGGTPNGGPIPEVWNETNGWATMDGIDLTNPIINQTGWTSSSWPYLFMAPNGELFHAGPTTQMHYINLGGDGSVREAGSADKGWYGKRAVNVMYEENKVMIIGGSVSYDAADKQIATDQVVSIDISGDVPVLTSITPMNNPRITHNGILLPNGEILVVGGRTDAGEATSVLTPEIWNPDTGAWTELADMSVPRNYHSTALLLPDGRVWSGGGGFCATECAATTHTDAQVFSPPYLFNADGSLATRPTINSAPETIVNGSTFNIDATAGLTRFTAIKMSAITHQMNTDLRRLYIDFTETNAGTYALEAHPNPNVFTPGYWMLFGVDANGVPSEAAIIQVSSDGVPQVDNPGIQFSSEGELVSVFVNATDNDPLTFSATGLPSGLSINSSTGEISGVVQTGTSGLYSVEVTVSDGISSLLVAFQWKVSVSQGEMGSVTVDQPSGGTVWHTVNLNNSYTDPVVVMGPPSYNGTNPTTVRVRNVTATSFEFQLDEWEYLDGTHGDETVAYLVVEAGSHTMLDGRRLDAGSTELTNAFSTISFNGAFDTAPVVFSQIGTINEAQAATTRQRNVGTASFEAQIEEEEGSGNVHAAETVYWVAFETGTGTDGIANEASTTGDEVTHNFHTINFLQSYANPPVFFAAAQTTDGGDTMVLRYQNLNGSSVEVMTEEEQANGDEVTHTTEVVGYVVFNQAGDLPFEGFEIPPIVLTNPGNQSGEEGEAVSLTIAVEQDNGLPITFSATGLPNGVSIDASTGQLSGGLVAGSAGTKTVTIEANDSATTGSTTFTWSIDAAPGSWIDFDDDSAIGVSLSSVPTDDGEEKDLAVGDLNKDGWDDIVVVRKEPFMGTGARADLLLMNESGTLVDRTSDYAAGFTSSPTIARDVIIADLDGDGWDDVLIANTFGNQPAFYRNLGSSGGTWLGLADESSSRLPTLDVGSIQYCSVAAGDVNGDGALDLYFSNYVMDGTTDDVLLVNDGNGNFADEGDTRLGDLIGVGFGTQADIIDMDGDGDNDIVKLSSDDSPAPFNTDGIFVLYNDGSGNFANWSTVPSDNAYMYIIDDFDNDGAYDFYVVDDEADYVNLSTSVTANTNISFNQNMTSWARTAGHGANLRAGDLDKDGDLDIGVADVDTSEPPCEATDLRAFLLLENENTSSGTFIDPFGAADKPWSQNMYDFAFVDVNNDGNLDIFTAGCAGYGLFTSTQDPVEPPVDPVTLPLGDLNQGIAAHDQRQGDGYIMFSVESIHDRFSATPPSAWNADHLIAVVFDNGQWKIDRNKNALVEFTPESTDLLVAEVDFTANTVNHLEGSSLLIEGINAGYVSGDLVITAEMWGGSANEGEFGVEGTEIVVGGGDGNNSPVLAAIGDQHNYVDDSVSLTLSATDGDGDPVSFTASGLPSGLNLNGAEISGQPTSAGTYNVTVTASDDNGGQDSESFAWTVDAGTPGTTVTLTLGDLNLGIAAHDQRTGSGYIMYSAESIHTRFADNPPSAWNADHLIAVVYDNGVWKIDRNKNTLVAFTPVSTDHLLAEVDFGADTVDHLIGVNTVVEGINAGYSAGDLVITAEMWGGSPNEGEFGVDGSFVEVAAEVAQGNRFRDQLVRQEEIPDEFALTSIYPNPFNQHTSIAYQLAEQSTVTIEVYSITGQRVRIVMQNHDMPAGFWQSVWDGTDDGGRALAAGVYMVRFQADDYMKVGKVVLVK